VDCGETRLLRVGTAPTASLRTLSLPTANNAGTGAVQSYIVALIAPASLFSFDLARRRRLALLP
jgi:hypothetical protein